jgi:hypothetical protein
VTAPSLRRSRDSGNTHAQSCCCDQAKRIHIDSTCLQVGPSQGYHSGIAV